jgi:hypothetical protein
MNYKYCSHTNSSECDCSPRNQEISLVIPRRYLSDHFPRKKQNNENDPLPSLNYQTGCTCDTHVICHCPIYQQSCTINTHQYQRIFTIPLRFRKGLKKMTTFIQYNNFANILPTIPSKFSLEYLQTKNWHVLLKALHVPKNKSKKGILYVLMENEQLDKSGWFEMEFRILAKRSHASCFCSKCTKIPNTGDYNIVQSKKRKSDFLDNENLPCVMMPFSSFVTEMKLNSQAHLKEIQ